MDKRLIVKRGCDQHNLTGVSPLHGSHAALPIACDALNARTVAIREYHYIFCAVVARKLLSGPILRTFSKGRCSAPTAAEASTGSGPSARKARIFTGSIVSRTAV